MALNPYINSFDTQADYEEYLDGSSAKAPNVAYIRATDTMKYTKTVPNPTWIIYGTTSGTTDFIIGDSRNGFNMHVQDGIFYTTMNDIIGNGTNLRFSTTEGQKITKIKRWTYPNTNVTSMNSMFYGCRNLTSIDFSSFNTSSVTNTTNMFDGCSNLTTLDLSSFNTSNITDMSYMFHSCSFLTSLDISSFDTTKVISFTSTFWNCARLNKLILGPGFFNSTSLSDYDLSNLYEWTDADSLETFVQAAEVHDGTDKTIRLSTNTKNALTQTQKDRITGAGWTIG